MRATCGIAKRLDADGQPDYSGKPSEHTEPCNCDRCEAEPGFHHGLDLCAEHYDELQRSSLQERIKQLDQEREQYVGKKCKIQIEGEKLTGVEFYDRLIARLKEKSLKRRTKMNEQIPPVNYTGAVPCDWCGSWSQCDKCADDPKVAERMHHLCWISNDNPMDEAEGGHIHACCDAQELYWKDAHFATSLEGVDPEEIVAMLPKLEGLKRLIALVSITDNDPDHCGCVVDEDGSTITACPEHPEGGSPKGYIQWAYNQIRIIDPTLYGDIAVST